MTVTPKNVSFVDKANTQTGLAPGKALCKSGLCPVLNCVHGEAN